MDLSRVLISVVGTNKSPHHENWLECAKTWVPYLRKLGYKVVILLSDNKNIVPYIGDETGRHLAIQHYVSGHMEEISHYHKLY